MFSLLLVLIVALAIITRSEVLPRESWLGHSLYWIHDNVYLWVKGQAYHRFFPFSIVWWIGVVLILMAMIAAYLLGISMIRDPHSWLLARAVRQPWTHRFLKAGARLFRRIGTRPVALRTMVEREYHLLRQELLRLPDQVDCESSLRKWLGCATLRIHLIEIDEREEDEDEKADELLAAVIWFECYQQCLIREQDAVLEDWMTEAKPTLSPVLGWISKSTMRDVLDQENERYHGTNLVLDVIRLWIADDPEKAPAIVEIVAKSLKIENPEDWFPELQMREITPSTMRKRLLQIVAEKVENRTQHLWKVTRWIEAHAFHGKDLPLDGLASGLPRNWENMTWAGSAGKLSLLISLEVARRTQTSQLSTRMLEAVETLHFSLRILASRKRTRENFVLGSDAFGAMFAHQPEEALLEQHRRIVEVSSVREVENERLLMKEGWLTPEDLRLNEERIAARTLATGSGQEG